MKPSCSCSSILFFVLLAIRDDPVAGLQNNRYQRWQQQQQHIDASATTSRRDLLGGLASACGAGILVVGGTPQPAWSAAAVQDSLDVDTFLRRGVDIGGTMGVSSQAGKSRPETGVYLRDGSDVSRNRKTGDVNAEIVLNANNGEKMAVFVSYSSPWPLGKKCGVVSKILTTPPILA